MWRLFYPLRYFALVNNEKRHLDLWPTILLAAIIATPFIVFSGGSFFRPKGFLDKLLTLTSALTGFYVAALVAAATFNHPDLDKTIQSGPIVLLTKDADGHKVAEHLSRREFVCTIFGYLAFAAFLLSLLSMVAVGISSVDLVAAAKWKYVGLIFTPDWWIWMRRAVIVVFSIMTAHLAVATALGIYYLMDRLYRRDRQIVTKKSGRSEAA